jgi:translation initiation factor IF-2
MVTSGVVRRGAKARVIRDGTIVQETSISQLKRFKDDAREVAEGFECGILLDGFNDVKEGDVIEAYETREVERTTLDERAPAATTS